METLHMQPIDTTSLIDEHTLYHFFLLLCVLEMGTNST